MAYTVKALANISGVSVRTLHWYDRRGLLKPSFYGAQGYRYYEEDKLLLLQQILFFKELGFSLNAIGTLMGQDDFSTLKALEGHRTLLTQEIERKNRLLKTIDRTISHLKGNLKMADDELYAGFDRERQRDYEAYIVQSVGHRAEVLLKESQRRTEKWDPAVWEDVKREGDGIHRALAGMIERGLGPEDPAVQEVIAHHYRLQSRFFDIDAEVYRGLAQLYGEHPDFKKFFDVYHPQLIELMEKAMDFFADKNLQ